SLTLLFNTPPPTNIYTLSLHDALPIFHGAARETIWRQSDLWEGWLPRRSDRADARAGNGLLRDRRRRSRARDDADRGDRRGRLGDRKSTRLNSSHSQISYAVFCLKKKK